MKVDTLAPSLFPDVLSHNGETYCALLEVGTGLVVLRWPDGFPERDVIVWIDAKATTHGFARLTSFNGDVFVAYRRDWPEPEHVVAVDLTTGVVAPWTVPCWGMHPLSWGMGGLLAVTADLGAVKRVLVANWPDRPRESPLSRDATQAPTGISRITGQKVIFWHEEPQEPLFQNRVWTPDITGSTGVTFDDRVIVDILGVRGQVLSGHAYKAPRIAREGNGAYTVSSHREGSQGPTGVEIVTGITQADLVMPEEPVSVAPYHRPVAHFAYYTFDAGRGYGNHPDAVLHAAWCETQADVLEANKLGKPVLTSRELIGLATKRAFVMASNDFSGAEPLEEQIAAAIPICVALECGLIVYDEHGEQPQNLPEWAVSAVRLFREPDESIQQYVNRALLAISSARTICVCAIFGVDDRAGTLTEQQVNETANAIPELIREAYRIAVAGFFSYARARIVNGQHVKPGGAVLYPQAWAIVQASADASDPIDWADYAMPDEPIGPIEPEPPEDNVNVYLPIPVAAAPAGQPTKPGKLQLVGERVNQPDGGFAIKAPNGKWTTLRDNGTWDTSATEIKEWERFYDGKPGFTVAPKRGNETYYVETVQGP